MMDEEREDEAIIPEEDFREAIAACCEDPQLKRYFRLAPPGAKLFIGLGFYSTHFGERVDPRQYAECQSEIEPSLTVNDLKYLIRFEDAQSWSQNIEEEAGRGALEGLLRGAGNVTIDMVYYPDINSWNGRDSMQYVVKDYRIHS